MIADMKAGLQNGVIGSDPIFLPRIGYILEELYTGGFMAVVDVSKFFYQFQTHPDNQPFLGLLHPMTQEMFEWLGVPMGSGNSPALGGRYSLAFCGY